MPKKSMFFLLLFTLLLSGLKAQSPAPAVSFPADWLGRWSGQLAIYNERGLAQQVPMELHILPLDSAGLYTWRIIYGTDTVAGLRPYLLRTVDAAKGHYAIDEQNTIVLDNYLLGGKLYNIFEVQGILLVAMVEKQGEYLHYEIISGKNTPVRTTGKQTHQGEEIPEVKAYPVAVRQVASLRRE